MVAITPAAAAPAVEVPVAHGGGAGTASGAAAEQRSAWSGAGLPTPKAMVAMLDEYVVGQSEAKKVLAVAVFSACPPPSEYIVWRALTQAPCP